MAEIYKSPIIARKAFERGDFFNDRIRQAVVHESKRAPEIARICSMWNLPDIINSSDIERITEETIWATTLLAGAIGKPGKPIVDIFLIHAVTSTLFLPSLCKHLVIKPEYRAALCHHWLVAVNLLIIIQGFPEIKPELLMKLSADPLPPSFDDTVTVPLTSENAIGSRRNGTNPWTVLINSALFAVDTHTLKALRSLLYGAVHYGTKGVGEMPGAFDGEGEEVLPGIGKLNGSIFIRAAGALMDTVGWVDWGQPKGEFAWL